MGRRKHELLTEADRERVIGLPDDRDALARLYTFEQRDIDIIGRRREKSNLLGVVLQLALLRHPGMSLAQWLHDRGDLPEAFVAFIAAQLQVSPTVCLKDMPPESRP